MNSRDEKSSLAQILKSSIIPWVEQGGMARVFTAPPRWETAMELPSGVKITRHSLRSKRLAKPGRRHYGGATIIDSTWPEDEMHSARTPKLCFVVSGPTTLRIADYAVHCREGHGILLPPGVPFSSKPPIAKEAPRQGVHAMLMLMPYRGGLLCWLSRYRCDQQGQWHVKEDSSSIPYSRVTPYLNQLSAEAIGHSLHRDLVCDSLLKIVVAQLHREIHELPLVHTGDISFVDGAASMERKEFSIAQAQEYVHHHLRDPLSIDKVARYVCMSRTVFTEQFRSLTGKTFSTYVADIRFEEAANLLRATDLSVRDICHLVGLKPCRLRSLFQEREGISPSQFRLHSRTTVEAPRQTPG